MRDTKELLIILRDSLEDMFRIHRFCGGMCSVIWQLYLNHTVAIWEHDLLLDYLNTHKPKDATKRQRKYVNDVDVAGFYIGMHWWTPKEVQPRIDWLNEQINSLS